MANPSTQTTPEPPDPVEVQAIVDASGHSWGDAAAIVRALHADGWEIARRPMTEKEKRAARRQHVKETKDFHI